MGNGPLYYLVLLDVTANKYFNDAAETKVWSWTPQKYWGSTLHQVLPADLSSSPIWSSFKLSAINDSRKTASWTRYVVNCNSTLGVDVWSNRLIT